MKNYDNILSNIYNTPWLITPEGLEDIIAIVERKIRGEEISFEKLEELREKNEARNRLQLPESPGIAVLPIHGSIFPKANLLTEFSGGTSIEKLMGDFDMLMGEPNVKGILLDIDSPGGKATMTKEMADVIYEARQSGEKPIWAIANALSASGSYYLGSQAEKLFMTPSGTVGSIGVVSVHTDETKADAEAGVKHTVLRVGENKYLGSPMEPLDDKTKQIAIEDMTEIYNDFVADVARGRGVSVEDVVENYGKGRTYKSRSALEKGMVDGVKTMSAVSSQFMDHVFTNNSTNTRRNTVHDKQGVKMPEITRETLEVLGLNEDATSDDVLEAVTALAETPPAPTPSISDIPADFAKQFPEQARLMAELQMKSRQDDARMFAKGYERFSTEDKGDTGFGFSGLALTQVEELHLKITDGVVTHEDLKTLLDNVASGAAVVNYGEIGSTRGTEPAAADSAMDAATQIRDKAYELVAEEGLSYGDALSKVYADPANAALVDAYKNATKPVFGSGGDN